MVADAKTVFLARAFQFHIATKIIFQPEKSMTDLSPQGQKERVQFGFDSSVRMTS